MTWTETYLKELARSPSSQVDSSGDVHYFLSIGVGQLGVKTNNVTFTRDDHHGSIMGMDQATITDIREVGAGFAVDDTPYVVLN